MSEFSPQAAPIPPPTYTPPSPEVHWLKRKIVLGQSIPWLALYALIIIGAGFLIFAPESKPDVNRLAFGNQALLPAAQTSSGGFAPVSASNSSVDLSQMQDQVAGMVAGIRTHSETNRQAIEEVAASLRSVIENQKALKQQVQELQTQNAELQAKMTLLSVQGGPQTRLAKRATTSSSKSERAAPPSPLASMQLRGVQNGMAWVLWQDKTWAVQVGDPLGPVTITGIDPLARQVRTSAGTLQ
ncbi:conjugal transfer protein TraP [Pseudomonas cichorii]|nr:conjugal transfer protein TraP [Pseudomonas cichorii]MBX8493183.1 conjugal transfer protein TraP [Pseudomonas cichorii]